MQDSLQEIVQLVGKESLSEDQKVVLDIAEMIVEDFLYQNAFTKYDYQCPLAKSVSQSLLPLPLPLPLLLLLLLPCDLCSIYLSVIYSECYHSFLQYFKHVFKYLYL